MSAPWVLQVTVEDDGVSPAYGVILVLGWLGLLISQSEV